MKTKTLFYTVFYLNCFAAAFNFSLWLCFGWFINLLAGYGSATLSAWFYARSIRGKFPKPYEVTFTDHFYKNELPKIKKQLNNIIYKV